MAQRLAIYTAYKLTPTQLRVKAEGEAGIYGTAPKHCVVTGGTGFVGQRLVEMLVERGAERVVSFDIVPPAKNVWQHQAISYVVGDLRDAEAVSNAVKGADCVWHIAAAVGPFHPYELYKAVNVDGTANVIAACRKNGVNKLVFSSSPSTRFDHRDPDGWTEDELAPIPQKTYVQEYAKTKAEAEVLVRQAVDEQFFAIAVAPHMVYGPRDNLFLPNFMEVASSGKLRIFGEGKNRMCYSHVDNYCHALILAEKTLFAGSKTLGKFYIATDGDTHTDPQGFVYFWDHMDEIIQRMGFPSISQKFHMPLWFMYFLGWICEGIGYCIGKKLKLSRFTVRLLTMHRWFKISAAEKDLGYKPLIGFSEGWDDTVAWFKEYWLPYQKQAACSLGAGYGAVAQQTMEKIDIQSQSQQGGTKIKNI